MCGTGTDLDFTAVSPAKNNFARHSPSDSRSLQPGLQYALFAS